MLIIRWLIMRFLYKSVLKALSFDSAKLSLWEMDATLVLYTRHESRSESLKGILCRNCYVLADIIATLPLSIDNTRRHRWNSRSDRSCAWYFLFTYLLSSFKSNVLLNKVDFYIMVTIFNTFTATAQLNNFAPDAIFITVLF